MAEENVCPICFEGDRKDDSVDYFLPCAHRFHGNCINPWLNEKNTTCPVCRTSIFATAPGEEPYPGLNVNPNQSRYPGEYVFNPNAIVDLGNDDALINIVNNMFNSNLAREIADNLNIINLDNEMINRINDLRIFYNDNNIIDNQQDNQQDNPRDSSYYMIISNPPYSLPYNPPDEQLIENESNINDPHAPR